MFESYGDIMRLDAVLDVIERRLVTSTARLTIVREQLIAVRQGVDQFPFVLARAFRDTVERFNVDAIAAGLRATREASTEDSEADREAQEKAEIEAHAAQVDRTLRESGLTGELAAHKRESLIGRFKQMLADRTRPPCG